MLTNTLNTNEVKNAAGTEVEFTRLSIGDRRTEFAMVAENPALPNRLIIQHSETGTGLNRKRRSVVRFDKSASGDVDNTAVIKSSCYIVLESPIGNLTTTALPAAVIAQVVSFVASLGASTTILYDGTGNGATALLTGGL